MIVTAAAIVRRDEKGDAAYLSRRLSITPNKAHYICSVLADLGLIGEDGRILIRDALDAAKAEPAELESDEVDFDDPEFDD